MWVFIVLLAIIDVVLVILIIEIRADLRELKKSQSDLFNSQVKSAIDLNAKYLTLEKRLAIVDNKLKNC